MAGVALGAVSERKQADRHPRLTIDRKGWLDFGAQRVAVDVVNVSAGGCAVRLLEDMPPMLLETEETRARLTIEAVGAFVEERSLPLVFRRAARAGDDRVFGCEFGTMQAEEYFVLADLMYGDPEALPRFLLNRRKHKSVWAGTGQFVWWGLVEPLRAFAYYFKATREAAAEVVETPPALPPAAATDWLKRLLAQAGRKEHVELPEGAALQPAAVRKSA
jgi:cellulose synthase (UDP-forming)